jgi:alkanesulfonate monooxygenase SsuD/methylene tetrahydromethanopterin reductase-like flavin-dependent oxidoreductase (luciferase family)
MKLAATFAFTGNPQKMASHVRDLESAGIDVVITPEIYGFDLVSTLGYLAGQTTTVELMSGIMPLYSRSAALIAQSAADSSWVSARRAHRSSKVGMVCPTPSRLAPPAT